MQPERQQPWQINIHAKAKSFDFKFQATTILPTSKIFPFPIKLNLKLKLFPSLLQPKKSEPHFPIPWKGKSLKSKFLRILGKFRPRPSKNKATASNKNSNLERPQAHFPSNQLRHFAHEEPICIIWVFIGFIALLLSLTISQTDQKGRVLYSLIIWGYLVLILNKLISRRKRKLKVIAIVAMLIWIYVSNILKIDCVWKTCMEQCSSFLAQIVHSSISQYMYGAYGHTRGVNHPGYFTF